MLVEMGWRSSGSRCAPGYWDGFPTNSNDATARPVEQAIARSPRRCRVLPVFFSPRYFQFGENEQWARIAGWLAVIVTRLPFDFSCAATVSASRVAMPRP